MRVLTGSPIVPRIGAKNVQGADLFLCYKLYLKAVEVPVDQVCTSRVRTFHSRDTMLKLLTLQTI